MQQRSIVDPGLDAKRGAQMLLRVSTSEPPGSVFRYARETLRRADLAPDTRPEGTPWSTDRWRSSRFPLSKGAPFSTPDDTVS